MDISHIIDIGWVAFTTVVTIASGIIAVVPQPTSGPLYWVFKVIKLASIPAKKHPKTPPTVQEVVAEVLEELDGKVEDK